jgi:hypothetical protein
MKNLLLIAAVFFIVPIAKSQYLIITNNNDTIEAKILDREDTIYNYRRIQKPTKKDYISINFVKKLIAIGDDTLFNTYISLDQENTIEKKNKNVLNPTYETSEIVLLDSTQTSQVLFNKAQKFIALNFKNSQRVVQLSDRISGTIICKGTMSCFAEKGIFGPIKTGYMNYTITVMVKNGKYKLDVNQIGYSPNFADCLNSSVYPILSTKAPCGLWKADWEYIKENYQLEMESFMKYFKSEMAKPVSDDW